jgi:hypothetical protein
MIARQRSSANTMPQEVEFMGEVVTQDGLLETWASYFQQLATSKEKPHYHAGYKDYVSLKYEQLSMDNVQCNHQYIPCIHNHMVSDLIDSLKNNKSPDIHGISAEHLKNDHPDVINIITLLLERIVRERTLPSQMWHGLITPVFKQKKSAGFFYNYHRITVISMIGKLLEKILVIPTNAILHDKISGLQRGFCDHASSINTALLITEAASEAMDLEEKNCL